VKLPRATATIALAFALGFQARAEVVLYETGFDEFTEGANNLSGSNGWLSTLNGQSVHGIDDEIIPGLGKSAFLGFTRPASNQTQIVTVFRPVNYDPVAEGKPIIEFEALIGIADSQDDPDTQFIDESSREDRFIISVYNVSLQLLASVIYDNRTNTYGLYRTNGSQSFDTGFEFVIEEPQFLFFRIDFENNTWSASLDGAPLFTDALFTSTGRTRDLGTIAAEWDISNRFQPGDNWMLFDDWIITANARSGNAPTEPFTISKVERTAADEVKLTYPADAGCTYRVQFSTDLKEWQDLPSSPVVASETNPAAIHTDPAPPATGSRFYRIVREEGD